MKKILLTILFITLVSSTNFAQKDDDVKETTNAANEWLELVDSAKYKKSWDIAAEVFKKQIKAEQWESALEKGRNSLGKLVEREFSQRKFTKKLATLPDGNYVVIQYNSKFKNKPAAVETLSLMKNSEDDWKVIGYFIR